MTTNVTVCGRTFVVAQPNNGCYIYDAGRTKLLAITTTMPKAVEICEKIAKGGISYTCRTCKFCEIRNADEYAERHFCKIDNRVLDTLAPCELWRDDG